MRKTVLVRANTLDKITEALNENAAGEHIAQRSDVLAVAVRLVERLCKTARDQKGKVCVIALQSGVGVRVAVDGVDALDIFRNDMAVGVHAEGAHLVAVLLGAVYKLRLVNDIGDVLKNRGRQLDTHTDIDLIVYKMHTELLALVCKPLGSAAAGGCDEVLAVDYIAVFKRQRIAVTLPVDGLNGGTEAVLDDIFKVIVHVLQDTQIVLGSEMLDLCLQKVQVVFERLTLKRLGLGSVGGEGLVRCAVLHVDGVDIVYKLHDLVVVHEIREPAAESGGEIIFAVGKCACAAEAAHGVAYWAVDAFLDLARNDGAVAGVYIAALLKHDYPKVGVTANKLVSGENSCGSAADDGNIVIFFHSFHFHPLYRPKTALCIIVIKWGIVINKL